MEQMKKTLNDIISWGNGKIDSLDNERLLLKQLSKVIKLYFELNDNSDDKDYPDPPAVDSKQIWKNVKINFPNFTQYNIASEITKNISSTELIIGDPYDDLVDIIKDFMDYIWYIDNTTEENGIWHFKFGFMSHWGKHLFDLQYYLYHYLWDM